MSAKSEENPDAAISVKYTGTGFNWKASQKLTAPSARMNRLQTSRAAEQIFHAADVIQMRVRYVQAVRLIR